MVEARQWPAAGVLGRDAVAIDVSVVVGRDDLAQQLRVLKAASGRSNTQVAADGGLSTSGIEGMLAGANLPNEDTVRRFVQACARIRGPGWRPATVWPPAQPKTLRLPQEIREELEALRVRNSALCGDVIRTVIM